MYKKKCNYFRLQNNSWKVLELKFNSHFKKYVKYRSRMAKKYINLFIYKTFGEILYEAGNQWEI